MPQNADPTLLAPGCFWPQNRHSSAPEAPLAAGLLLTSTLRSNYKDCILLLQCGKATTSMLNSEHCRKELGFPNRSWLWLCIKTSTRYFFIFHNKHYLPEPHTLLHCCSLCTRLHFFKAMWPCHSLSPMLNSWSIGGFPNRHRSHHSHLYYLFQAQKCILHPMGRTVNTLSLFCQHKP